MFHFNTKHIFQSVKPWSVFLTALAIPVLFNSCKGFEVAPVDGLAGEESNNSLTTSLQDLNGYAVSGSEIRLTWSLNQSETYAFSIFRDDVYIATTMNTNFTDIGLASNTTYTYKVFAADVETGKGHASGLIRLSTLNDDGTTPPPTNDPQPMPDPVPTPTPDPQPTPTPTPEPEPMPPHPAPEESVAMYSYNSDLSNAKTLDGAVLERKNVYLFISNQSKYKKIRFFCCKGISGESVNDPTEITIVEDASAPFVISKDMSQLIGGVRELYVDAILNDNSGDYDSIKTHFTLKQGTVSQPTEPPTPTPPPTGGDTPTSGLIFEDNFNSSTPSSYWNGQANVKVKNGSYEFYFKGGGDSSDSWAEARFDLKKQYNEITIIYDLYIPHNYFHRDTSSGDNNKFLRVWTDTYNDLEKMGMSMGPQDSSGTSFIGEDYSLQSGWGTSTYVNHSNNFITPSDRGKWMAIKIYVKTASDSSPAEIKLYKNGALLHQNTNIQNNYVPGQQGIRHGYLLGWANSGFSQDTYILIDNVKFYSGEK